MKKLLLPFFALVFLISCEKERDTEILPEQENIEDINITTRSSNKRDVCHNGNIININVNAIPAHQAHGDAVDWDEDGYFDIENDCGETDCDDTNAAVHPDAEEVPYDGFDNDCDAATLDDDLDGDGYPLATDCDDTTYDPENSCGCIEGEVEIDFNGPLFVAPADEAGSYNWQGAITACAAKAAADGCGWYLPNKEELHALFLERVGIGNFDRTGTWPTSWYWSSKELYVGGGDANAHFFFYTGEQQIFNKVNGFRCRCVRR
jgi:hypothetical protein